MRLMQQNLDHLTEMEATAEKLIESYDKVMAEMEQVKVR